MPHGIPSIPPVTDSVNARIPWAATSYSVTLHYGPALKLFILVGWDWKFRLLPGLLGLN